MSDPAEREALLHSLCSQLDISFADLSLLDKSLTHASAAADRGGPSGNYESLEFVGDAVLDLSVAQHLYTTYPDLSPGQYTQMRARIVNKSTLAEVARGLALGDCIQLGKGEDSHEGRNREALLADCMESVFGALFVDGGWESADAFIVRVFADELAGAGGAPDLLDYRPRLQNECQSRKQALPEYRVVNEFGPDHAKEFSVEVYIGGEKRGFGTGTTKKSAEQRAACEALSKDGTM